MTSEAVSTMKIIDVRTIPPISRHATIFAMIDALESGEALQIVNDHDPVPLRYQLEKRNPGVFSWKYRESGPVWRVEIGRPDAQAKDDAHDHADGHECTCGNH